MNSKKIIITLAIILSFAVVLSFSGCTQNFFFLIDNEAGTQTKDETQNVDENEGVDPEEQKRLEEEILEEWLHKNEELKEKLGSFYVPLPTLEQAQVDNPPVKARGLYLTGNTVGLDRFNDILDLVASTELNSVVIDVKNDHGLMTYQSEIEIVQEVGANKSVPIKNIEEVIAKLNEKDIYPIARIVVFKDPHLAEQRPDWAIQSNKGGIWRDNKGVAWINPYKKEVWDYNIAIAKEAALVGFREIQFDYVRFPENAARVDKEAYYPDENGIEKDDNIKMFLEYAREQLADYNVHLAADTFGVIATSWGDADRIGQNWEKIAPNVDYNCPMIYPSHYGPGYFGYSVPDAHPAGTVRRALIDAINRNAPIENPSIIRPWLQSFTASWIKGYIPYGANEVRAQIEAALELGIDEYLIWNPTNRYPADAFLPEEKARKLREEFESSREAKGHDVLGRTRDNALDAYMDAIKKRSWREVYTLQGTDFTMDHNDFRQWLDSWTGGLVAYEVGDKTISDDKTIFEINFTIRINDQEHEYNGEKFEVYKENKIWKVKPSQKFIEMLTYLPPENVENSSN